MKSSLVAAGLLALAGALCRPVFAGPPFVTNDPDPPEVGQFEIITPLSYEHERDGTVIGGVPFEVNYGHDEYTQWTIGLPGAFSQSPGGPGQAGLGDMMLEYKRRFGTDAAKGYFGIDPQVTLATGDESHGLGAGRVTVDVPLLYQKQFGKTVFYTDVRYRWQAAANGGSFVFMGAVCERELTERLTVGAELFATTPSQPDSGYNLGMRYGLGHGRTIIVSAGSSFRGDPTLNVFAGLVILTPSKTAGQTQ